MKLSTYLFVEGVEPKKPLGKITKSKVVKNRGMINQKSLDQIQFDTTSGNNVKVQFQIRDGVGDVVFYVNDTLDDLGGRKDGSVDPEILGGVLWAVDAYADRLGLDGLTFSAWAGSGDTKTVRGLDVRKPLEVAKKAVSEYLADVKGYDAQIIPPSENRIALAKKLGREPTVVYDVNVGKLSGILGEMLEDLEDESIVRSHAFEEEVYLSRNVGSGRGFSQEPYTKLEELIPGAMEVLKAVRAYNVAKLSHTEAGASVTRNRREDLYKRLIDKFFSSKWCVKQNRDSFELTRKGVVESVEHKPVASWGVKHLMFAMFDDAFAQYGQYYIPLFSHVIKKIFGDIQGYGWHITSMANLERLKSIQGTNRAISALHRNDISKVVHGGGVASGAEVAVLVKGNVLLKYDINAWTVVDENGNRWVPVVSNKTGKAIGQDIEGLKLAYAGKLQELALSLGMVDWRQVHDSWGRFSEESRTNLLTRFVKSMEEFVLENAETIKDSLYGAIDVSEKAMDEVDSGFNEIVISDFHIVKVLPVSMFEGKKKFSEYMNGDQLVERQSLDTKRAHILRWSEEALEGLRSGNYFACEHLKMPFGRFFGAKVVGKYDSELGLRNTYYFGMVDGDMGGSATGRADVEGNEGTVWVKSYGVYDALEGSLRGIDVFQAHISKLEGVDVGGTIFALGEGEKKVLYHELSHVYDMMERGAKGVSGTQHRWSSRPEEIEAELNALYNAMLADSSLTLKDFENSLTPDHYGIGSADGRYDTIVGPLYGWAENNPEKVKISHKKILRRWIDMRQMVMDKLKRKGLTEGLIKVPYDTVAAWVDSHMNELVANIKETFKKGYQTYVEEALSFVNAYNGETEEVTVYVWKDLSDDNMDVLMNYDKQNSAINISAKTVLERYKKVSALKEALITGIVHELTHAVDPGRDKKKQVSGDMGDYVNSPREFPAFVNMYVDKLKRDLKSGKLALADVIQSIRVGKFANPEINSFLKRLNDDNRRKFLKLLYTTVKGTESKKLKFSDLMNEMPAWNDASKSLSDDISGVEPVMNVIDSKGRGGFRTIDQFEIGEYVIWVMSRSREKALCCIVGYKGKVHVGEFDWYLNPFGWTTESAVVHQSHQGRGIAFGVYKYMIENHMTTLYSDNHLTGEEGKGSFDIWAKLGRTFPHKYVYDSIEDIAEEVDGFTRDMMGDSDKLFVVSTEDILA